VRRQASAHAPHMRSRLLKIMSIISSAIKRVKRWVTFKIWPISRKVRASSPAARITKHGGMGGSEVINSVQCKFHIFQRRYTPEFRNRLFSATYKHAAVKQ
jgi:hypothetical protein